MLRLSLILVLCVAILVSTVNGFGFLGRRDILVGFATSISLPSVSIADTGEIPLTAPLDYSGVYRDPRHREGFCIVRANGPGLISLTLQDDPGGPILKLTGTTSYNEKTRETNFGIDLSKTGGPASLPAVYSPDKLLYVNFCETGEILTKGSIAFQDGNVWVKDSGLQGVYVNPRYPDGYRTIRELGNARLTIETADRVDQLPNTLPAVVNKLGGSLVIDLSVMSGPKRVSVEIKGTKLIFPDGNVWEKL